MIEFDAPKDQSSIIKTVGIGGGGGNAVNHMFKQGIEGVDFILCNTDAQALENSPIPNKIHIGKNITEGLGAGADPEVGRNAAIEESDAIRDTLSHNTRMLFITAGMGGGTGTGAAPVVAEIAKELNILTIAIVTIPFAFEGRKRKQIAEKGIEELKKHVDSIIVINNDKMIELHGDLSLDDAFAQADNILATGSKAIAELISKHRKINLDFKDVRAVMRDSGVALMGNGIAKGENRALKAAEIAMNSPLLDENDIRNSQRALLNISYSAKHPAGVLETSEITKYITDKLGLDTDLFFGAGEDDSLNDEICITLIATGFKTRKERDLEDSKEVFVLKDQYDNSPNPEQLEARAKDQLKHQPKLKKAGSNSTPQEPDLFSNWTNLPQTEPLAAKAPSPTTKTENNDFELSDTNPMAAVDVQNSPQNTAESSITQSTSPTADAILINEPSNNYMALTDAESTPFNPIASIKTDATEFTFSLVTDENAAALQEQDDPIGEADTLTLTQHPTNVEAPQEEEQPAEHKMTKSTDIKIQGTLDERIKQMQALSIGKHATTRKNTELETVDSNTQEAPKYTLNSKNGKISIEHTPNGYINKNAD